MAKDIDINIVKYLQEHEGATVSELEKHFRLGRTTLLYRLKTLIQVELIVKYNQGRKVVYYSAEDSKIAHYYQKELEKLRNDFDLVAPSTKNDKKQKKLQLVFANYYDLLPAYKKVLAEHYTIVDYTDKALYLSPEEFIYRCKDADVIVNNWGCTIDDSIVEALPRLQYMHVSTLMYRYVDLEALKKRGIHFSHIHTPDYRSIALVEYVLAQTFALFRKVNTAASQLKSGVIEFRQFQGEQLRGKIVGILGTDELSKTLIPVLKNLGTEVMVYCEDEKESPIQLGLSHFSSINEIMSQVDIIYILNSTDEGVRVCNRLDATFLNRIKKPLYLISIAKHTYVDVKKIRELIYEEKLKGLALDYFADITTVHTVTDSQVKKIFSLPNVLITPDIAWYTKGSVENLNNFTNNCLIAYAQGDYKYLLV